MPSLYIPKPEEFDALVASIQQSHHEPGNSSNQEVVLKKCITYLFRYGQKDTHLFCDPSMYPVTVHIMILFSFPNNGVLEKLKPMLADSLWKCDNCLRCFNLGKSTLRIDFAANRQIEISKVNQFIGVIVQWETQVFGQEIQTVAAALKDGKFPSLTSSSPIDFAIRACLYGPQILRNNTGVRDDFMTIISNIQAGTLSYPYPELLLPGAFYLLFEGQTQQKLWAAQWLQYLKEKQYQLTATTVLPTLVDEFSVHLYRIQDANFFSPHASIDFWTVVHLLLELVDNEAFMNHFNVPPDINLMRQYTKLRLYPILRLFMNNLLANLKDTLPILLKVLLKLLAKYHTAFWGIVAPITYSQVLDSILVNPEFNRLLFASAVEEPENSKIDDSVQSNILLWIYPFLYSLNETNNQTSSRKLANYLLKQVASITDTSILSERLKKELLDNYALRILLLSFQFNVTSCDFGSKNYELSLLKIRDTRATIENNAAIIVSNAYSLSKIARRLIFTALSYDVALLAHSTSLLMAGNIPTSFDSFPLLWDALNKSSTFSVNIGTTKLLGSLSKVNSVVKFSKRKNEVLPKQMAEARAQHNENVTLIFTTLSSCLAKVSLSNPSELKKVFLEELIQIAFWSCLFSPLITESATDVLYQVFDDVVGRYEAFQGLLETHLQITVNAIDQSVQRMTQLAAYEPSPRAIRILMDVVKGLTDPLTGILSSSEQVQGSGDSIVTFWSTCWSFLIMVYQKTLTWANQFHLEELIEFTRDTLDLSHFLLDNFRLVADSIPGSSGEKLHSLFRKFMNAFHYMIVWLRLGDASLLNSCVELVFKGFELAKDLDFTIDVAFIETFAKFGAKAKKFNNKLTEQQRLEILSKAREFDEGLVDKVITETALQRGKAKKDSESGTSTPEPPAFAYQNQAKQPRQQTLGRFGVVTTEAPVAPAPKGFKSSSLDSIRKDLVSSRATVKPSVIPAVNPAPPRPAGFNSKKQPAVGRSLNQLKKKRVDSDSSEDELDTDTSDLFVDKSKKKVTVTEIDMYGRPVAGRPQKSKVDIAKREEENMRNRLNVSLKPLYSTILKWNYNSNDSFPTGDRDSYKEIKSQYDDVKDYVKTTEPLLMLECWQGIQSAKQTGQEKPFEILVGSRTSVDGFFDVYGSVKKSVIADRKVGDSDLLVLGFVQEEFSTPEALGHYLKAPTTRTCLAKVREIKSANPDYNDITVRVYPSGSMMGVLTPKSQIVAMRISQMVTIEREYTSLKGLQYYDLCDSILAAKPNEPVEISDAEAMKLLNIYDVNKSQAKAIIGSYNSEGFSLIQGPPGTGKTKTILGIVGYSLSQQVDEKIIIKIDQGNGNVILGNEKKPKVLICAPSNAAVDELVVRLRDGVRNSRGEHIIPKLVRMGRSDAINAAVKDLTLEELVEKELQAKAMNTDTSTDPNIRAEHLKCIEERDNLRRKLQTDSLSSKEIDELESALREINKKRTELGKQLDLQRERVSIAYRTREIERRNAQAKILNDAQIICSTLSGSAHDFLANMGITFDQVVIDEACQCVELSSIIPLRYGCKKCIMVGDPNQLPPTVLSQAAASFNYEQSLFVRMQQNNPNSVYLLDVQYRMHPQISAFPSAQFYQSRLKDGEGMAAKNERPWHSQYPLSPYRFFDIVSRHQRNELSRSLFNTGEARVALELVEKLMTLLPEDQFSGRIGIISPYKEQIKTLRDVFIKKYGYSITTQIDFNTVDGFQGQEKEIIIMSCVRASDNGNVGFLSDVRRMNVALTRARTTLWILGNKESLMRNKIWNKLLTDATDRNCVSQAYPGFLSSASEQAPGKRKVVENRQGNATKRSKHIKNEGTVKPAQDKRNSAKANPHSGPKKIKSSIFGSSNPTTSGIPNSEPELIQLGNKPKKPVIYNAGGTKGINGKAISASKSGVLPPPSNSKNDTNSTINKNNTSHAEISLPPRPSSSGVLPQKPALQIPKARSGVIPGPKPNGVQPTKSGTIRPPTSAIFISQRKKPPPKR